MILMIDNYDSFTYNLVQYLRMLDEENEVIVKRNDQITIEEIEKLNPDGIVISPGPSNPDNAGVSIATVTYFAGKIPIMGVCLGHQTIGQVFGGKVIHAKKVMHGKVSEVQNDGKGLFAGITKPIKAMRYHSLAVERESLPECFTITAETDDGEIMGIRHNKYQIESIQFHPESIMTTVGKRILKNFIKQVNGGNQ